MNAKEKERQQSLDRRRRLAQDWWFYRDALQDWLAETTMPNELEEYELTIASNGLGWALLGVSERFDQSDDPMIMSALPALDSGHFKNEARHRIELATASLVGFRRAKP